MNWAILIPLAPFLLGAFAIWTRHRSKMFDREMSMTAEKAAQYAASNAKLEARVRVLEKIITDRGVETAAQIEALRDSDRVEGGDSIQ